MAQPPLIIIGMHRSGTSLITKVLERSGIFMGVVKDHNFEAMHFLSLNQQALWSAGFDWHKPGVPASENWQSFSAQELYWEHFKITSRWRKLKLRLLNPKWGWKDPRNTFTLNHWLKLYPGAKVLHIQRNREAVVKSLQKRNKAKGEVFRAELNDPLFCGQLWQQYRDKASSYRQNLGDRFLEIDYEDLIGKEKETVSKLEHFSGVKVGSALDYFLS
jgi:hypothetical protein